MGAIVTVITKLYCPRSLRISESLGHPESELREKQYNFWSVWTDSARAVRISGLREYGPDDRDSAYAERDDFEFINQDLC